MKNFKKYLLILTCAGIGTSLILANKTDSKQTESQEIQPVVTQDNNDQNKQQIVPVAPAIEEQKPEIKSDATKPEDIKKEELAQINPITKTFFNELIDLPREQRLASLDGGLKLLLNNSLDKTYSKEEQGDWINILAHWIKDEWTKNYEEKISIKDFNALVTNATSYLEQIKKENNFSIVSNLILLDDIYKPYFLKILFPELEQELKDVKLNEAGFSVFGGDENCQFSFSGYSFIDIPEKKCNKVATKNIKIFNKLALDKQLSILASWLLREWTFNLEAEKAEE